MLVVLRVDREVRFQFTGNADEHFTQTDLHTFAQRDNTTACMQACTVSTFQALPTRTGTRDTGSKEGHVVPHQPWRTYPHCAASFV